jgi:uncharacterized protein (DUF488 family)
MAVDAISPSCARVFTWGYQGREVAELLETLRQHGIEQVLDVRENSSSRKPGFSGDELQRVLTGVGVAYAHLPQLGCERDSRHLLWRGGPHESFVVAYRRHLTEHPEAYVGLRDRIGSSTTLLLCLERDADQCHRGVLAERLRRDGLWVQDL